ncbi:MAG: Signal recognition particle core component [Phylliscum demangeonii]|nr:MAG: Signal recognition particle core component [Phylliscum demangeonii]
MSTPALRSLAALVRQTTIDDHDAILIAANRVLKDSPSDINTLHIKAVALLKLDRFHEALDLINAGGSALQDRARSARAYALYQSYPWSRDGELWQEPTSRVLKHIAAQAWYRSGEYGSDEFSRAADIYDELGEESAGAENEDGDLTINRRATDALLQWNGLARQARKSKADGEDLERFETAYNVACSCIARGEYPQAGFLLSRAKDLCEAREDLSPEKRKVMLLWIALQHLCVLSRLGKSEEAQKRSKDLSIADIQDPTTLLFYRSPGSWHPLPFQMATDLYNYSFLQLICLKHEGLARSASAGSRAWGRSITSVVIAAAVAHNRVGKAALKALLPLLERQPEDLGFLLTVMQQYLLIKNHGRPLALLDRYLDTLEKSDKPRKKDARFRPGLVGLVVLLASFQGRKNQVRTELRKAAEYWLGKPRPPTLLLQTAGSTLLATGEDEDARTASGVYEALSRQDPKSMIAAAGFVAANADHPNRIASALPKLTPVARLTARIDAAALEEAGVPRLAAVSTLDSSRKRRPEALSSAPPQKRARRKRLPKNYDPSKAPDPERWLPLRERSSYRPKGKKGKAKMAGATQGGVSTGEKVEQAGGSGVIKAEKPGGGNVNASKSKKKKGKGGK